MALEAGLLSGVQMPLEEDGVREGDKHERSRFGNLGRHGIETLGLGVVAASELAEGMGGLG